VKRTLVLGLGNPILRDDAVGIRLVEAFQRRLPSPGPAGLVVEEACLGGLALAERARGFDRLIVVDAIRTQGGRPGDWYRFDARNLRPSLHLGSVHDAGFATAFGLCREAGLPLPAEEEIHLFAVEVEDPMTFDERMSEPLAAAFPRLAEEICRELADCVGLESP
jgi:hydrogenase maturation protease